MTSEAFRGAIIARGTVKPDWIDINDHMNVAWYVLAFDLGVDALWNDLGITPAYTKTTRGSTFAVECHITYQQELLEGDNYLVTGQILAYDEKRIHQFQRLYHAEKHYLAATAEWLNLHVDLDRRRVTPWPDSILEKIGSYARAQTDVTKPAEICGHMNIKKPLFSLLSEQP
jgi:acyl-CoA thioester hydrolase